MADSVNQRETVLNPENNKEDLIQRFRKALVSLTKVQIALIGIGAIFVLMIISASAVFIGAKLTSAPTPSPNPIIEASTASLPSSTPSATLAVKKISPTKTTIKPTVTITPSSTIQPTSTPSNQSKLVIQGVDPIADGKITNCHSAFAIKYQKDPQSVGDYFQYKTDNNNWSGWIRVEEAGSYNPFCSLGLGNHTLSIQMRDAMAKETAVTTYNFTLADTEAPQFTDIRGPAEGSTITVNNTCIPYWYEDNANMSNSMVRLQFDGNWTDWLYLDSRSPIPYPPNNAGPCFSNLSNGQHTFSVQVRDESGNTSGISTKTFNVSVASPTSPPVPTSVPTNTPIPPTVTVIVNPSSTQ